MSLPTPALLALSLCLAFHYPRALLTGSLYSTVRSWWLAPAGQSCQWLSGAPDILKIKIRERKIKPPFEAAPQLSLECREPPPYPPPQALSDPAFYALMHQNVSKNIHQLKKKSHRSHCSLAGSDCILFLGGQKPGRGMKLQVTGLGGFMGLSFALMHPGRNATLWR